MLDLRKIILSVIVGVAVVLQYGLSIIGLVMFWQWYQGWPIGQEPKPIIAVGIILVLLLLITISKHKIRQLIPRD
jgi:hypothetical protein